MTERDATADEIAEVRGIQHREIWNRTESEAKRAELVMRLRVANIRLDEIHHNAQRAIIDAIAELQKEPHD